MGLPPAGPRDRSERTVAVIGASADRAKFGNKAVRAYAEAGYTVWPVNPREPLIEGIPVFATLDDLPALPHRVTIYLKERAALETLERLAGMQDEYGDQISAVYLNPGADPPSVVARAEELGLRHIEKCSIRAIGRSPDEFGDDTGDDTG